MKLRVQTLESEFALVQLEDGRSFEVPRLWLPASVFEGDVLRAFGNGDVGLRLQPEAGLSLQRQFKALPSAALDALQQLSMIAGTFDLEFANAVVQVPDVVLPEALEVFVGRNFLRVVALEPPSYTFDRALRSHLLRLPLGSAALEHTKTRHLRYVLSLALRWQTAHGTPDESRILEQFEARMEDFRAALEWALPNSDTDVVELGARLAVALETFWWRRGYFSEGRRWLEFAAQHIAHLPLGLAAKLLYGAGIFAQSQGEYSTAFEDFEGALEIFERIGELQSAARVLGEYGFALMRAGRYDRAEICLQRQLEAAQSLADKPLESASLNTLGMVALRRGFNQEAEAYLHQSLALKAQLGDQTGTARSLTHLAIVRARQGSLEEAQTMLLEALELRRELGDRTGSSVTLHALGMVALSRNEVGRAAALMLESLHLAVELSDAAQTADTLEALARVALNQTQIPIATQLHGAAQALRSTTHSPRPPAFEQEYQVQVMTKLHANLEPSILEALIRQGALLGAGKVLELAKSVLEVEHPKEAPPVREQLAVDLSPREREVLVCLVQGESNKRIAKRLSISENTVKTHLTSLFNKLGVNSRTRAVALAAELNLL